MPKLYPEALLFCLLWAALAVAGFSLLGLKAGLILSIGLLVLIMPSSALILSRTGNFALERGVRWGILAAAAVVTFSLVDAGG
jgi:hypothetical protein